MKSTFVSEILFILVLLTAFPAFSQKIPDELEEKIAGEMEWLREEGYDMKVVTASRKSQKISEAPASIISITREQIQAFGWRDLKDVFRAIPGVDVSYNVQGEVKSYVIMRGVTGNQKILILQDGHKYSPATGGSFLYGNNMPLNIYKRIEIIYGPASSLYGADAYAGVINLITKDGQDYDGAVVNAGWLASGAWLGDLSFGKKVNADTDFVISARTVNGEDQKLHKDYEEYAAVDRYSGELGTYDNDYPIENWNFFLKLRYKKFLLGFDWQHEYESAAAVSRPDRYAYVEDFAWGQDMRHFYIDHDTWSNEQINIRTSFEMGDYEVDNASNYFVITGTDENGNPVSAAPGYKYACSSYLRGSVQMDWSVTEKFSAVMGLSYEKVKSFPTTRNLREPFDDDGDTAVDMTLFTDANGYTFGILGFSEPYFRERKFYNMGAFVQAEYKFSDRFKVDAGIRWDYNDVYKETFNPRIGLIANPFDRLTVKLLYGTAYIQPSNDYRYQNFANPFMVHIPNEDLDPEELKNYSLDMTYAFGTHFLVRTALFYNEMDNIIRPVEAPQQAGGYPYYNPYRTEPGYVEYNGNQGEIVSKGGEITLTHKLDRLQNSLSYSYVTGDDSGYDIAGISEHKVTLNSSWTAEKWMAGLTLRYYGDVNTSVKNYKYGDAESGGDESYSFDGALIAYLNLVYKFTDDLSVTVTVDNLFDTEHYAAVPFDGSPVVVPRNPQPLRQICLGLTYRY
ncbi:MAG: TonB-dependent receptor [Desulfobacterales bacterium]